MKKYDHNLVRVLPRVMVVLSVVFLLLVLTYKINNSQFQSGKDNVNLPAIQNISIEAGLDSDVHVAEPFEYTIRVIYRPDKVRPDFRQLLRDISFSPFEQRHKTRTRIVEYKGSEDIHEYVLSYTIIGIDVIPGNSYKLDDVTVRYTNLADNSLQTLTFPSSLVQIERFYTDDPLNISLQAVKEVIADNTKIIVSLLIFSLIVFVSLPALLLKKVLFKPHIKPHSIADKVLDKINEIKASTHSSRSKLIQYEKLLLSLFKAYGNRAASVFWLSSDNDNDSVWSKSAAATKPALEGVYRFSGPDDPDLARLETEFENIYAEIEQQVRHERLGIESQNQGTLGERVKTNIFTIVAGIVAMIIGLIFLLLIINQDAWMDQDGAIFNRWMNNLPERLLAQDRQHELNNLDIEVLGHISDEYRVLENLQSDELRSAYLYNYGTLATNIYKSILLNPPQDEEEEASEPPTFEFPLQLMANAARFNPDDEDVRRNLEIIIGLRESQKKDENGEVQGELGPPTPGFSRDMNPLLF